MLQNHSFMSFDSDWVYPWIDLLPVLLPKLLNDWLGYTYFGFWILGSVAFDLVGLWALLGWRGEPKARRVTAAYFWIGLQFALGPVAISRLDNLSIALAMIGIGLLLDGKEVASSIWFAIATWVKVWPAALLLAVYSSAQKIKSVFLQSQIALVGILVFGFLIGKFHSISFLFAQNDRGIQIESPIATFWLWARIFNVYGYGIYFDPKYLTFQVMGFGEVAIEKLLSLAFYLALAITAILAFLARKSPAKNQVFALVALTAILDMLVLNKVGSPQYIGWLFVPVVFAVATGLSNWRGFKIMIAITAAITFVIYPVIYDAILQSEVFPTAVLTIRNLLLIALLVQANRELIKLGKQAAK